MAFTTGIYSVLNLNGFFKNAKNNTWVETKKDAT